MKFGKLVMRTYLAASKLHYLTEPSRISTSGDGLGVSSSEIAEASRTLLGVANLDSPVKPLRHASSAPSSEFSRRIEKEISFLRCAARRWYREHADAEDLVQDTLVQALANAHLWQPGSDLRGWLFTIMRNRFFAGMARSVRSTSALEQIAFGRPQPTADGGELRLLLRDLSAALHRLPSNQRSAVMLIGVEGKSYDEAANTMGTSVEAVRSYLKRGRDRLRAALRGNDARPAFAVRQPATRAYATPSASGAHCAG